MKVDLELVREGFPAPTPLVTFDGGSAPEKGEVVLWDGRAFKVLDRGWRIDRHVVGLETRPHTVTCGCLVRQVGGPPLLQLVGEADASKIGIDLGRKS